MKKIPPLDTVKKTIPLSLKKIKEKTSRISLTLVLSLFTFGILILAVGLAALGLWILTEANVLVDTNGDLLLSRVILFMFLISFIIGGVIAFFSSRIPLKPINESINKMNRLAAGDFKTRIVLKKPASVNPAVREFAESFNQMAEELEHTELLRSDFINNLSHEFKTPIVSIMGFASLLEAGNLPDEKRIQYAQVIREESTRLSSLANNVLNLTKVENQAILTDISQFNLSEQVRAAVLLLEEKWTGKDIDLQLNFDEYIIDANEELLKQIWINLIDNAVKFAPVQGSVCIEILEEDELLCVKVSNTGSEIPPDQQEKIFNKFYQADESHTTQGNGIGLAIAKRIVDLHLGSIEVFSENNLTTFSVILPKVQ